jgi:autotransporter-associated beta strand protein
MMRNFALIELHSKSFMKNFLRSFLLLLIAAIGVCSHATAQRFAVADGNWTDAIWASTVGGTAGTAATPTSSDAVTINVGRTITINTAASCASFAMTGASSSASTVSISGTNSLNCVGAFTMSLPNTNTTNVFAVAAGTLTVGGTTTLSTTTNTAAAVTKISLTTGTINFNGAVSLNARSSILTNAVIDLTGGRGTVNFGFTGTVFSTSNGTFSAGTSSTCVYNGGAQTLGVFTYDNLKLAGSGIKTGSTSITVNDTLTVAAAIGTVSASPVFGTNATLLYDLGSGNSRTASSEWPATFTATGGVNILTGTVTLNANKTTESGPLTVSAGATLALSTFTLGGTAGPSSLNLECGAATGSAISGSGILTLGGNVTVNDVVSNSGTSPATISCPVALVNLSTRTFTINSDGTKAVDLLMTGIVSTSGSIIKAGVGTMEMQASSTYTGSTTVNAGILRATTASVVASTNGAFGFNASALNLNGGKIESNTTTFSRPITVQTTNKFNDHLKQCRNI